MKIRNLKSALGACALIVFASAAAFAQVGRIEGDVIKADTKEPVVGAKVQIIREDIKGNYDVNTDKKGHFLHAGVPYVGRYTLIISAPNCEPAFQGSVRPTGEPMKFELRAGDGRVLTMDDVKKAQGGSKGGPAPANAAESKKQQEEYEKKRAEIESQNKKVTENFEGMKKLFETGLAKLNAKDYNGAVADLNEAGKLDPEQYSVWANLALALYNRGVTNFNESMKDPSKKDPAKQDFNDAVSASGKAIALAEAKIGDPAKAAEAKKQKSTALKIKADSEALLAARLGVMEMADAAVKDYREAGSLAENPADAKNFELKAAGTLYDAGKVEEAVTMYQAILQSDPENIEALYKMGLAYAALAKFQESADTLQKFVDKAPATDPRVVEVKAVIKDLIVGNNLQPPKAEKGGGKTTSKGKKP